MRVANAIARRLERVPRSEHRGGAGAACCSAQRVELRRALGALERARGEQQLEPLARLLGRLGERVVERKGGDVPKEGGNQKQSAAIRSGERVVERKAATYHDLSSIRRNQTQSDAIRRNQTQSDVPRLELTLARLAVVERRAPLGVVQHAAAL